MLLDGLENKVELYAKKGEAKKWGAAGRVAF